MKKFLYLLVFLFLSFQLHALDLSDTAAQWKARCAGESQNELETQQAAIDICTMSFVYYLSGLVAPNIPAEEMLVPCAEFDLTEIAPEFVNFIENNSAYEQEKMADVLPKFFQLSKSCT
ncbi:hypothetical protein JL49_19585 [Pseudoalteromonas luteoviolacea]|nr:hypothetical protein JL49_19585 [Pseudoalteromonas luteoviolacea]